MSTTSAPETATVTDQNGVRYELTKLLDEGRQGKVYATERGRLAVKIATGGKGNQAKRELLKNQLAHVRRLPLRDLALAKPLAMLRPPHMGYVMEFLTDMVAIKTLISPQPGEKRAADFSLSAWYIQGGGLRKRLLVLGRVAHVLSQLHGKGLAYGDLSPANVFISKSRDAHEVWLIDTDNLRYASAPCDADTFHTPGYGAPEVASGKSGATPLADVFSFAVIAFETLSRLHPFLGDMVQDGDPDLEEQAFAGELPWVDDPDDDSNRATPGLPRQLVLSPRLKHIFQEAFGPGRSDPTKRPRAMQWAEKLYGAADATIECPACAGSFYFTSPQCPWCNTARPSFVHAFFYLWDPEFGPQGGFLEKPQGASMRPVLVGTAAASEGRALVIPRRLAFGETSRTLGEAVVSVTLSDPLSGPDIKLQSLDDEVYTLFSPTGRKTEIVPYEKTIRLEEGQASWRLHFGQNDERHRVVSFKLCQGGGA